MDRYAWDIGGNTPHEHGQWVKYSDAKAAIDKAQIDMARCSREGDDAFIRAKNEQIEALQARVRELEEVINEISPAVWDDARMKYVNVQVSREVYDQIQSLKGTP